MDRARTSCRTLALPIIGLLVLVPPAGRSCTSPLTELQ
jgi:hypothetical protein